MENPSVVERIVHFLTGTTPGKKKKLETACRRASDKIDVAVKERVKARKDNEQAHEEFKQAAERQHMLTTSVILKHGG